MTDDELWDYITSKELNKKIKNGNGK